MKVGSERKRKYTLSEKVHLNQVRGTMLAMEAKAVEMAYRKTEFLELFHELQNVPAVTEKMGVDKNLPYIWMAKDSKFKEDYQAAKLPRQEEIEDFLYELGTGQRHSGKDEGITVANVTAAIFLSKAMDPKRFGERVYKEENKTVKITTIEVKKDYVTGKSTETLRLTGKQTHTEVTGNKEGNGSITEEEEVH
jgi:hypothetical protein